MAAPYRLLQQQHEMDHRFACGELSEAETLNQFVDPALSLMDVPRNDRHSIDRAEVGDTRIGTEVHRTDRGTPSRKTKTDIVIGWRGPLDRRSVRWIDVAAGKAGELRRVEVRGGPVDAAYRNQ